MEDQSRAFAISELLDNLKGKMNRSTVYRTLDKLIEKRLIVKLIDSSGETIYILNRNTRLENSSQPHLKCRQCGVLLSLPSFPVDYMNILTNYGVNNLNLVLDGFCSDCSRGN